MDRRKTQKRLDQERDTINSYELVSICVNESIAYGSTFLDGNGVWEGDWACLAEAVVSGRWEREKEAFIARIDDVDIQPVM